MGNQIPPGVPPLLAKNWQPVPEHPNSFRNKLTFDYTHKHIVNVEDPLEIQSFKTRMKEINPYICHVLFYHQYHQSIYHVYTDQIHLQPNASKQQWPFQKIKIVESFAQLARSYGYFKVCLQMVGSDSGDHPKIWIHPDPVAGRPWSPCNSESMMIIDIAVILNAIQEKFNQSKQKNQINKSILLRTQTEYTTFQQYIQALTNIVQTEHFPIKTQLNKTSTFLESSNTTTNFNINIKVQLDSKKKKSKNKTETHIITNYKISNMNTLTNQAKSQIVDNVNNLFLSNPNYTINENANSQHNDKFLIDIHQQRFNSPAQYQQESPNKKNSIQLSKLQKLLNTSIQHIKEGKKKNKNMKVTHILNNSLGIQNRKQSQQLQRPSTQHLTLFQCQNKSNKLNNIPKRDSQSFKIEEQPKISNSKNPNKNKIKATKIFKQIQTNLEGKNNQIYKKNPLSKLITHISQFTSLQSPSNFDHKRYNKSAQGFNQSRGFGDSISIQNAQKNQQINRKQQKYSNIPSFLMKSSTQLTQQLWSNEVLNKHPSTQRRKRNKLEQVKKQQINIQKQCIQLSIQKSQQQNNQSQQIQSKTRSKTNTVSLLTQQLHHILETPIEPQSKPINLDYQHFKTTKIIYKDNQINQNFKKDTQFDDFDIIKQKVQEKRVRFAQLKLDAKKILEDSV